MILFPASSKPVGLHLLQSMPASIDGIWRRRAAVPPLVLLALLLPLCVGALAMNAFSVWLCRSLLCIVCSVLVWFGLLFGAHSASSSANAVRLFGCWIFLTLFLPALANLAIARAIPIGQGIELTLAQRQIVHNAWDIPKEKTLERFVSTYPQWRDSLHAKPQFQWRFDFVMHKVGDDAVATNSPSIDRRWPRARRGLHVRVGCCPASPLKCFWSVLPILI